MAVGKQLMGDWFLLEKANPCHVPSGPKGGEFCSTTGGGAFSPLEHWDSVKADPDYAYHATGLWNAKAIADSGKLRTHGPSYGTDQSIWPDGSRGKRAYFIGSPKAAESFVPEGAGKATLLRIPRKDAEFKRESTGDLYITKPVSASSIQALNSSGDWVPLTELIRKEASMPEDQIQIVGQITKVDDDKHLVFGWASVVESDGELHTDLQGDQMDEAEMEKMAYAYVLDCREQGVMHKKIGVGKLVESIAFTKEKQAALGIDLGKVGWFIGFKVSDPEVWDKIKKGEYRAFSIHGRGHRERVSE